MRTSDFHQRLVVIFVAAIRLVVILLIAALVCFYLIPSILEATFYSMQGYDELWGSIFNVYLCLFLLLLIPTWILAPQIARRAVPRPILTEDTALDGAESPVPVAARQSSQAAFVVFTRIVAVFLFRTMGLFIGTVALLWSVTSWLFEGIRDGDFMDMYYYGPRLLTGASVVLMSFATILFARRLARVFVRMSASTCPGCSYNLENFRADRCPECGLYLGPDFHAPPSPGQSCATDPAQAGQCSPPTQEH